MIDDIRKLSIYRTPGSRNFAAVSGTSVILRWVRHNFSEKTATTKP